MERISGIRAAVQDRLNDDRLSLVNGASHASLTREFPVCVSLPLFFHLRRRPLPSPKHLPLCPSPPVVRQWISAKLERRLPPLPVPEESQREVLIKGAWVTVSAAGSTFAESMRDGVILCEVRRETERGGERRRETNRVTE